MVVKTLGRADKQISLSLVSCPPIDADVVMKTHAFDNVLRQVESYIDTFDYAELSSFLSAVIPGNSAAAAEQATEFGKRIRDSLFSVNNVESVINFFNGKGEQLPFNDVFKPPGERTKDVSWVSLGVRVDATPFLPGGVPSDPNPEQFFGVFTLSLPQSSIKPDGTPVRPRQLFGSLTTAPPLPVKKDVKDLPQLTTDGTPDTSGIGDKDGTDTWDEYTDAVIKLLDDAQKYRLWSRSSTNAAGPSIPQTMARAVSTSNAEGFLDAKDYIRTYTGGFDFLEDQEKFDQTFPKPIKLAGHSNAEASAAFDKFVTTKQFFVLQTLMRYDYVGSHARMDHQSTKNLVDKIRRIKLATAGSAGPSSVDELFRDILYFAHMLPESVDMWHCSLPEVFLQALPSSLRDTVESEESLSESFSASKLTTKDAQLEALRAIRTVAVREFNKLTRIKSFWLETLAEHAAASKVNKTSSHVSFADKHDTTPSAATDPKQSSMHKKARYSDHDGKQKPYDGASTYLSPAEQTLQKYAVPDGHVRVGKNGRPIEAPICVQQGQEQFPMNPTTNEVSDFPLGFNGCFVCGSNTHRFLNDCPQKNEPWAKQKLYKNIHCHKPHVRKAFEAKSGGSTNQRTPATLSESSSAAVQQQSVGQQLQPQFAYAAPGLPPYPLAPYFPYPFMYPGAAGGSTMTTPPAMPPPAVPPPPPQHVTTCVNESRASDPVTPPSSTIPRVLVTKPWHQPLPPPFPKLLSDDQITLVSKSASSFLEKAVVL